MLGWIQMNFLNYLKNFIELTRGYALLMTFASCMVIWAFTYQNMYFTAFNFILLFFALCCVHMGGNLFDDYIDVKMKLKEGYTLENMAFDTFLPKARLIREGVFSFKQVEIILISLFSFATLVGLYFAFTSDLKILFFMIFGGILVLFYPISPRYKLSETIIGLMYGPLAIMGGCLALTKNLDSNLFILSCAIFFTTLVLLHTDNIMDWEFDVKNNKNTLAILSKSKDNAINILRLIIIFAYSIVTLGVLFQRLNPFSLYVFLTLPIAAKLLTSIKEYVDVKDVELETRWYWGFFENWEEIKKHNAQFYMFRFYLARNFAFWFAFFAMLGTISAPYSKLWGIY